jgi:hypothetical protein
MEAGWDCVMVAVVAGIEGLVSLVADLDQVGVAVVVAASSSQQIPLGQ